MTCYLHTDQDATAFCRSCGRPLCVACQRTSMGTIYCEEHVPAVQAAPAPLPPPVAARPGVSPGLAFVLGLIPGVGAIYNGQYAKGVVHVVVFGTLISIMESGSAGGLEPLFGMLIALWFFYMAFEAYHTASKRLRGEPVDEFSSFIPAKSATSGSTVTAVALIVLGVLFLIMNLRPEWGRMIFRYWPVGLIAAGVWLLVSRWKGRGAEGAAAREVSHEQR